MTRSVYIYLVISVICLTETVYSWKFFHRGRVVDKLPVEEPSKYEKWITQTLDHFHPTDTRTWQQRYYVNDEFFNSSSRNLAFLMIGGEGEATPNWMEEGSWIDWAKEFRAICFQLEHRYYGKSHPTENLNTDNLVYLSSQQALADLAFFIESMNVEHELSTDIKWIVFGGSYPGSLAAWARQRYPHLIHGAVSTSGPLLAKLNFDEFFRVVADDLRSYSDDCLEAVKEGTEQAEVLLKHPLGRKNLDQLLNLCDPIEDNVNSTENVANLFTNLAGNFAGIAQYNKDNRKANRKHNVTLDTLCEVMVNQTIGPQINRLAAVNDIILRISNQTCLDYKYDKMIEEMRNVSWGSETSEGGRQWTYQTCTEFGFYQTSDYKPQIFGDKFALDFSINQCIDIFGPQFDSIFQEQVVKNTNVVYGALDIQVTNVLFVHGSVDPWHVLGITKTMDNLAPAIFIEGTAHCAEMYPARENDLPQLKAARVQIQQQISTWLDWNLY